MREFIVATVSFSLFVVCPRMAGMVHVISKNTNLSIPAVVVIGGAVSIPMLYFMACVFGRWGITGALVFCIATDLASAILMGSVGIRAGVETAVISLFVLIGAKVAPYLSSIMGFK